VHIVGQRQVAQDHRPTADRAPFANDRAAGHAHAAGHRGVRADMNVVADLDQVVELDAVFDHRVFQRTPVDAGVGPDFHIVADAHHAELFDLFPAPFGRCKAEAVGTDHDAAVHSAALTDRAASPQRDASRQPGVGADAGTGTDDAMRADHRGLAYRRSGLDHHQRPHRCAGGDVRSGADDGTRVHPRCDGYTLPLRPPLGQPRVGKVGIGCDDGRTACHRRVPQRRADDHAACARRSELRGIAWVGDKRDRRRRGRRERADALDSLLAVAYQLAAQMLGNLTQRDISHSSVQRRAALTWWQAAR
jgi:hypothetical protein